MTNDQAIIFIQQMDQITHGRNLILKKTLAQLIAQGPTGERSLVILDPQGESEPIVRFLARFNGYTYHPTSAWVDEKWKFTFELPDTVPLKQDYDPEQLAAEYAQYLIEFKQSRQEMADRILAKMKSLFPAELLAKFPFERLISWDPVKNLFSCPYKNVLLYLLIKLGIKEKLFTWIFFSKLQIRGSQVLFSPIDELSVLEYALAKDSNPLSPADIDQLADYIGTEIKTAMPRLKSYWMPREYSSEHESLYTTIARVTWGWSIDFLRCANLDLEKLTQDFDALNEKYFGKIEDFNKEEKLGDTSVGLCEAQGRREAQEDYLAYSHDSVKDFPRLTPFHQWRVLHATIDSLQDIYGKNRESMGSTVCNVIVRRVGNKVEFVTTNAGDSTACFAVIDPLTQTVKMTRRLNNLHNSDEQINPTEKSRIDRYCLNNQQKISENGRLSDGLAVSRCLGDTGSEPLGLIHTAEIQFDEIEIAETDLVYVWVTCDGIFERKTITVEVLANLILQHYQTSSIDKLAQLFVDASLQAGSGDNNSVAIALLKNEILSLSIFDGHGQARGSYLLAHEAGRKIYSILKDKIELALKAQQDPRLNLVAGGLIPYHFKPPVKKIESPSQGIAWDISIITYAHPAFNQIGKEYSVQLVGTYNDHIFYCRIKKFEDAFELFNFMIHISCQSSVQGISYCPSRNDYSINLSKHDLSMLDDFILPAKPKRVTAQLESLVKELSIFKPKKEKSAPLDVNSKHWSESKAEDVGSESAGLSTRYEPSSP